MNTRIIVVVLGDSGSGKTKLLQRMITEAPYTADYTATAGPALMKPTKTESNDQIPFECWEVGGAPRYRGLFGMYARIATILLYCVPLPSINPDNIREQIKQLKESADPATQIVLVGTKNDTEVTPENRQELKTLADELQLGPVFFTSAEESTGLDELRNQLFTTGMKAQKKNPMATDHRKTRDLDSSDKPSRRLHYLAITSLVLAPIALSVFLTVSLSLPAALPALATVLPFLLLVSPLAAGFIAGGLVAAVFLIIAATAERMFRKQKNDMGPPSRYHEMPTVGPLLNMGQSGTPTLKPPEPTHIPKKQGPDRSNSEIDPNTTPSPRS